MNCHSRRISEHFDESNLARGFIGRAGHRSLLASLIGWTSGTILLGSASVAHSGPCTAQIAQVEQQVSGAAPGPESGPTGPQTLGAQLHFQPTPADIAHAERVANKDADAALERARQADAAGKAAGCKAALSEAKRLYDIDQ